ncbi:DNA cytosine methyltransferase [Planomonospora sp. ID82291]|nr:DNA cytosine methyltransferase [Planomonospora sp. ID82291]
MRVPTLDDAQQAGLFDTTSEPDRTRPIVAPFAGPGGFDVGAALLGVEELIAGYDLDRDAVATGRAAGFHRVQADVRTLHPPKFTHTTGALLTPPCPSWSASGKRTAATDLELLFEAAMCLHSYRCGCVWQTLREQVSDPRTALAIEPIRWAAELPNLEWLIAELTPATRPLWEAFAEELYDGGPLVDMGWAYQEVIELDAADYGSPSSRRRVFLVAHRTRFLRQRDLLPEPGEFPALSMAAALGWEPGHQMRTRGNRRTSGGNLFSADRTPSWCLTEKARGWTREADGRRLEAAEAGLLNGFPRFYPWQGSRSKQFLQIADIVSPMVAAALLGYVLGLDWRPAVHAHLAALYGAAQAE